ncbi:MAG: hypothetical protein ACR2K2_09760 [Mycobacteriales bacterium]
MVLGLVGGAVVGLVAAPTAVSAAEGADPGVIVEAPRQVSEDTSPVRLFANPQVAVSPDDPSTVVVTVNDARNGGCGLRVSRDGGLSWTTTAENLLPEKDQFCVHRNFGPIADPEFASDGTLYVGLSASSLATDPPHPNGPITALVARSKDLGKSHETFVAADPSGFMFSPPDGGPAVEGFYQWRLPSLAVDPNDPNKLYMGWRLWVGGVDSVPRGSTPERSYIAVSNDGGKSWSEPVDVLRSTLGDRADELGLVFEGEKVSRADTPMMVVGPDSTVYAFTKERPASAPEGAPDPKARLFMFTSTDGGQSWSGSVISEGAQNIDNPTPAVDPENGNLYLAYASRGADVDKDSPPNPSEAYVIASTDGGASWSEPVNITDDDPSKGYDQYFPGISIAPGGRIDVAWYDFRNDPFFSPGQAGNMGAAQDERYWDVYYATSEDSGATWSTNTRVTNPSVDGGLGITFNNNDVRGPMGIASTGNAAYVVWSDSRASGVASEEAEDAYFSRIRFVDPVALGASDGGPKLTWAGLGAAVALLVGGLALLVASLLRGAAKPASRRAAE